MSENIVQHIALLTSKGVGAPGDNSPAGGKWKGLGTYVSSYQSSNKPSKAAVEAREAEKAAEKNKTEFKNFMGLVFYCGYSYRGFLINMSNIIDTRRGEKELKSSLSMQDVRTNVRDCFQHYRTKGDTYGPRWFQDAAKMLPKGADTSEIQALQKSENEIRKVCLERFNQFFGSNIRAKLYNYYGTFEVFTIPDKVPSSVKKDIGLSLFDKCVDFLYRLVEFYHMSVTITNKDTNERYTLPSGYFNIEKILEQSDEKYILDNIKNIASVHGISYRMTYYKSLPFEETDNPPDPPEFRPSPPPRPMTLSDLPPGPSVINPYEASRGLNASEYNQALRKLWEQQAKEREEEKRKAAEEDRAYIEMVRSRIDEYKKDFSKMDTLGLSTNSSREELLRKVPELKDTVDEYLMFYIGREIGRSGYEFAKSQYPDMTDKVVAMVKQKYANVTPDKIRNDFHRYDERFLLLKSVILESFDEDEEIFSSKQVRAIFEVDFAPYVFESNQDIYDYMEKEYFGKYKHKVIYELNDYTNYKQRKLKGY